MGVGAAVSVPSDGETALMQGVEVEEQVTKGKESGGRGMRNRGGGEQQREKKRWGGGEGEGGGGGGMYKEKQGKNKTKNKNKNKNLLQNSPSMWTNVLYCYFLDRKVFFFSFPFFCVPP